MVRARNRQFAAASLLLPAMGSLCTSVHILKADRIAGLQVAFYLSLLQLSTEWTPSVHQLIPCQISGMPCTSLADRRDVVAPSSRKYVPSSYI